MAVPPWGTVRHSRGMTQTVKHDTWCDGYATRHNSEIRQIHPGMRQVVCACCGPVSPLVGQSVTDASLRRMAVCQPQIIVCTGQCL